MEDFVTFEQAIKLKELGFDWDCDFWYYYNYHNHEKPIFERCGITDYYDVEEYWYAPTLAQTQKWLFEKFGIWIEITRDTIETIRFDCGITHADDEYREWVGMFDNPFEALSSGINIALQLIQKNKS